MGEYIEVNGFPDYKINRNGEIESYKRTNVVKLKPYIAGNGYYEVALTADVGKAKRVSLHRLIAEHFVPNPDPDNLKYVNHKDGNTLNNSIDNLEWVSASQNALHWIYGHGKESANRRTIIVDGIEFPTLKACAEHFKINKNNLSSQLKKGIIPRALRGKEIIIK